MTANCGGVRHHLAWLPAAALAGLLVALGVHAARAWRYFPMFIGDHGWYLQVALRMSRGEVLYRDVRAAYGPLPAQVLAALFRRFGPDAGLASLVNTVLAAAMLLLTYAALRHLLRPGPALALTSFAAVAGPYVGGDLIRQHLYAYTQAIAWGATLSLAAAVAALCWARTGRAAWLLASGAAAGLACLCKPEAAAAALATGAAVLAATRGRPAAWLTWMAAWGIVAGGGAAWQAGAAGWHALWRGYTGYDQLAQGSLWGMPGAQASPRWLLSAAAAWTAALALLVGGGRPRWQPVGRTLAVLATAAALALILPDLVGLDARELLAVVRSGVWSGLRLYPQVALQWIAAVPWSLLNPALLWVAWRGRRERHPAAWWGLWAFALMANLRFTFTGYAAGLAIAPALAVLWWSWQATAHEDRAEHPEQSTAVRSRRVQSGQPRHVARPRRPGRGQPGRPAVHLPPPGSHSRGPGAHRCGAGRAGRGVCNAGAGCAGPAGRGDPTGRADLRRRLGRGLVPGNRASKSDALRPGGARRRRQRAGRSRGAGRAGRTPAGCRDPARIILAFGRGHSKPAACGPSRSCRPRALVGHTGTRLRRSDSAGGDSVGGAAAAMRGDKWQMGEWAMCNP